MTKSGGIPRKDSDPKPPLERTLSSDAPPPPPDETGPPSLQKTESDAPPPPLQKAESDAPPPPASVEETSSPTKAKQQTHAVVSTSLATAASARSQTPPAGAKDTKSATLSVPAHKSKQRSSQFKFELSPLGDVVLDPENVTIKMPLFILLNENDPQVVAIRKKIVEILKVNLQVESWNFFEELNKNSGNSDALKSVLKKYIDADPDAPESLNLNVTLVQKIKKKYLIPDFKLSINEFGKDELADLLQEIRGLIKTNLLNDRTAKLHGELVKLVTSYEKIQGIFPAFESRRIILETKCSSLAELQLIRGLKVQLDKPKFDDPQKQTPYLHAYLQAMLKVKEEKDKKNSFTENITQALKKIETEIPILTGNALLLSPLPEQSLINADKTKKRMDALIKKRGELHNFGNENEIHDLVSNLYVFSEKIRRMENDPDFHCYRDIEDSDVPTARSACLLITELLKFLNTYSTDTDNKIKTMMELLNHIAKIGETNTSLNDAFSSDDKILNAFKPIIELIAENEYNTRKTKTFGTTDKFAGGLKKAVTDTKLDSFKSIYDNHLKTLKEKEEHDKKASSTASQSLPKRHH